MRLLLTLIDGEEIKYKIERDSVVIGRSSQCDLVISHESMSRFHCKIEFKDSEIFITDLGSINGVFVNGIKIPSNSSVPFHTYLHLAFGYVESAQLLMDDHSRKGVANPLRSSGRKESTESVVASRPAATVPKHIKAKDKVKNKSLIINVLAFFAVLAVMYYFFYGKEVPKKRLIKKGASQLKNRPIPVDYSDHF